MCFVYIMHIYCDIIMHFLYFYPALMAFPSTHMTLQKEEVNY